MSVSFVKAKHYLLKTRVFNNLEGWDGERGGKDVQVGGDMNKPMDKSY